jgi:16S rRNA (guanine966-N2)-methyltransferase
MSRIVAGELGGRRLRMPPGDRTRPTTDRVREALFSRVEALLGGLDGAVVLDLYAGSGAVGLEALSRGAAHAVLVECDRRAVAAARANVAALGVDDRARVVA